jgi:hypothetical protein
VENLPDGYFISAGAPNVHNLVAYRNLAKKISANRDELKAAKVVSFSEQRRGEPKLFRRQRLGNRA